MCNYVYKRNKDGVHYLDISKTWEKIMIAARVIAATQAKNPKDVLVRKKSITLLFYSSDSSRQWLHKKWARSARIKGLESISW